MLPEPGREPAANPPRAIGNYEVVRRLATGGMGELYLALQNGPVDFRRQVVLKKLHSQFTRDPQFVAMFVNEARIAANLAHPNIVHIYELFADGDGYVIAMEYVRGGSVLALLRNLESYCGTGLPYGAAVRIATSVCDALHYAYHEPDGDGVARQVIHRDVNPSNVLVGYDGQVKLVDFGIAKMMRDDGVTKETTIKGKYGYLTPEQIRCQPLDQRSDLFSLGTMLWEMSVGKRLFQRDHEVQMMHAILDAPIPWPSQYVHAYPKNLERVVMKALARSREDRYPDANALAHDLRAVARDSGWDTETVTLGQLVKQVMHDDDIAFGQAGWDSFAAASTPSRRRTTTSSWPDAHSFASIVVVDRAIVRPAAAPDKRWLTTGNIVAVVLSLVVSAIFWTWIVGWLDRWPPWLGAI